MPGEDRGDPGSRQGGIRRGREGLEEVLRLICFLFCRSATCNGQVEKWFMADRSRFRKEDFLVERTLSTRDKQTTSPGTPRFGCDIEDTSSEQLGDFSYLSP